MVDYDEVRAGLGESPMKSQQEKSSGAADPPELPFESEISERLRSVKNPAERRTVARLLSDLTALPLEQARAALETSALVAAVSLRASIEFLRVVPDAAQVLGFRKERLATT